MAPHAIKKPVWHRKPFAQEEEEEEGTKATLSLSIGATRAASSSFKARKYQIQEAPVASPERMRNNYVFADTLDGCCQFPET
jgi:hypothetical protein